MSKLKRLLKEQIKTSTDASIVSIDEISAESAATLHALNSREAGGWRSNILKIFDDKGSLIKRVMDKFYVGYGHKSIGDCGPGHVLVDDLSMLAANALEHNPLFSGQETSSRYVELSDKGFVQSGNLIVDYWTEQWLDFYSKNLSIVIEYISKQYPCPVHEKPINWEKAIKSRACDIMGSFLPSGAKTNMSIQMNLRQFADFMDKTIYHPVNEIREISEAIIESLQLKHPNSFKFKKYASTEEYKKKVSEFIFKGSEKTSDWNFSTNICKDIMIDFLGDLVDRPEKTELPHEVSELGQIDIQSMIDYRSFRDLHRQRCISFKMPIVTAKHGFEDWYLKMLPESVREEAASLLGVFEEVYDDFVDDESKKFIMQYAVPMGYKVPCNGIMTLNGAVYVTDLRSGLPVHPTARIWAIKLADELEKHLPGLKLHTCRLPDQFVPDRGKHDIIEKK